APGPGPGTRRTPWAGTGSGHVPRRRRRRPGAAGAGSGRGNRAARPRGSPPIDQRGALSRFSQTWGKLLTCHGFGQVNNLPPEEEDAPDRLLGSFMLRGVRQPCQNKKGAGEAAFTPPPPFHSTLN